MKKVLITGGSGFIGGNLVAFLNRESPQTEIVVLDDLSTGDANNLIGLECTLKQASIEDIEVLRVVTKGVDTVVHLGALGSVPRSVESPFVTHAVNATGTLNVLSVARDCGVGQVIVASSSSVYGRNPALPKQEFDWLSPMSPYAASKLAAEAYASAFQASYGLPTLVFRFFNVYGPLQSAGHDYAAVIPRFISQALNGEPLTIYGDGNQTRDFTYVESVCSAIFEVMREKITMSQPVNLAFGSSTSLLDLVGLLEKSLNRDLDLVFLDPRTGDVRESHGDPTLFENLLPRVERVTLEDGLRTTIDWFKGR